MARPKPLPPFVLQELKSSLKTVTLAFGPISMAVSTHSSVGTDDDAVIVCAMTLLKRRYSAVAMPALRDAIESKNRSLVFGAIFAWGELGYPELLPGMRRIAENSSDRGLQACALAELAAHSDGDWIRSLATTAPDERTRRMAWNALGEQPQQ